MFNINDDPEFVYGDVWNLRISYSNEELHLFDDDVKGTFRHSKYHPDVAGAFAFSISNYLMIPMGQTFGSIDSPQDWKPFARARTHLAYSLSHRRDLLAKHDEIITQVEFGKPPSKGVSFTPVTPDPCIQGILNKLRTSYNMFVDDSRFIVTVIIVKHAMAARIEALYTVLDFPDPLRLARTLLVSTSIPSQSILTNEFNLESLSTQDQ